MKSWTAANKKWIGVMKRTLRKKEDGGREGEEARSSFPGEEGQTHWLRESSCRYDQKIRANCER